MARRSRPLAHATTGGFTLIEMVVTLIIIAIVGAVLGTILRQPVQGYTDLQRRTELVDAAEMSLRLIARDIRQALPNSVRVSNGALELINTLDGARYRDAPPPGNPDKWLQFSLPDREFNVLGHFGHITLPYSSTTTRLVIYNLGLSGADAYAGDAVITPSGTTLNIDSDPDNPAEHHISLSTGHRFAFRSPGQRLYLIDQPIAYLCDPADGKLKRYQGHALHALQSQVDSRAELLAAGARETVVSAHLDCGNTYFRYSAGTAQRAGLVTLELRLSNGGEQISLLHQVHVDNMP